MEEKKTFKITLTEEELKLINGGQHIVKEIEDSGFLFSICSVGGKDDPGNNEPIFTKRKK